MGWVPVGQGRSKGPGELLCCWPPHTVHTQVVVAPLPTAGRGAAALVGTRSHLALLPLPHDHTGSLTDGHTASHSDCYCRLAAGPAASPAHSFQTLGAARRHLRPPDNEVDAISCHASTRKAGKHQNLHLQSRPSIPVSEWETHAVGAPFKNRGCVLLYYAQKPGTADRGTNFAGRLGCGCVTQSSKAPFPAQSKSPSQLLVTHGHG
jgi:hypothetical protein